MKITLTGSLGNISKPLAQQLINNGHQVTIISSKEDRKPAIEAIGAIAAVGSSQDVTFLTQAFTGADVVYTMVPPDFGAADYRKYVSETGQHYAKAILAAGVTKVVNLSSIGAHLSEGTGPIKGLHDVEQILNGLEGVTVKHLRPVYFFINFYGVTDMIKHAGIIGSNHDENTRIVLVHPEDIAVAAAEEIEAPFTAPVIRYIASDDVKVGDVATALGTAIGKPDLKWIGFTNEQAFDGMVQGGLPVEMATNYVEMGDAIRTGILWEDYDLHQPAVLGQIKLAQFAKEFAEKYA